MGGDLCSTPKSPVLWLLPEYSEYVPFSLDSTYLLTFPLLPRALCGILQQEKAERPVNHSPRGHFVLVHAGAVQGVNDVEKIQRDFCGGVETICGEHVEEFRLVGLGLQHRPAQSEHAQPRNANDMGVLVQFETLVGEVGAFKIQGVEGPRGERGKQAV